MLKIINKWLFYQRNTYTDANPIYYILWNKFIDNEIR